MTGISTAVFNALYAKRGTVPSRRCLACLRALPDRRGALADHLVNHRGCVYWFCTQRYRGRSAFLARVIDMRLAISPTLSVEPTDGGRFWVSGVSPLGVWTRYTSFKTYPSAQALIRAQRAEKRYRRRWE